MSELYIEDTIKLKSLKEAASITGQRVGYRRVSSVDQKLDRQDLGPCDRVFEEKVSGKNRERPELARLIDHIREGDGVVVYSTDRLARNLVDLQSIVNEIIQKGASVKFLTEGLEFKPGTEDAFKTLQLQLLGAFAQFERALIRSRQLEGIERAKARGKYNRRSADFNVEEARRMVSDGLSIRAVAEAMQVPKSTLHRALMGAAAHG